MNLIEQLAQAVKNLLGGVSNNKSPHEILTRELLAYRRQHNIFEVGDKVVFIESELKNPRLMTVIEVREPICGFLMAECSLGITNGFYPSRYRHATDAEIKAGKRLEVS